MALDLSKYTIEERFSNIFIVRYEWFNESFFR